MTAEEQSNCFTTHLKKTFIFTVETFRHWAAGRSGLNFPICHMLSVQMWGCESICSWLCLPGTHSEATSLHLLQPFPVSSNWSAKRDVTWDVCTHPTQHGPALGGGYPALGNDLLGLVQCGRTEHHVLCIWKCTWQKVACTPGGICWGGPDEKSPTGGWGSSACICSYKEVPHARNISVGDLGSTAVTKAWKQERCPSTVMQMCEEETLPWRSVRPKTTDVWQAGSGSMGKGNSSQMLEQGLVKADSEILRLATGKINLELNNIMYFKGNIIKSPDTSL